MIDGRLVIIHFNDLTSGGHEASFQNLIDVGSDQHDLTDCGIGIGLP